MVPLRASFLSSLWQLLALLLELPTHLNLVCIFHYYDLFLRPAVLITACGCCCPFRSFASDFLPTYTAWKMLLWHFSEKTFPDVQFIIRRHRGRSLFSPEKTDTRTVPFKNDLLNNITQRLNIKGHLRMQIRLQRRYIMCLDTYIDTTRIHT